jgi:hypothetical protein
VVVTGAADGAEAVVATGLGFGFAFLCFFGFGFLAGVVWVVLEVVMVEAAAVALWVELVDEAAPPPQPATANASASAPAAVVKRTRLMNRLLFSPNTSP